MNKIFAIPVVDVAIVVLARDCERALTPFDRSVQIMEGNLTNSNTLGPATKGARHIVDTSRGRSGFPVREVGVKAVEYEGVLNTIVRGHFVGHY